MNAKEAVAAAKKHLVDIMSDEAIDPPTLEEVWFEAKKEVWRVTLAVRRIPKKADKESAASRLGLTPLPDYKTITISDKDGGIVSLKDRIFSALQQ